MEPLKETITQSLETWLVCGYAYNDFWDYSFAEVDFIFKHHKDKMEQQHKQIYTQAYLTGMFASLIMAGEKVPAFEELFESKEEQTNNVLVKELFMDYAEKWNKQRRNNNAERNR